MPAHAGAADRDDANLLGRPVPELGAQLLAVGEGGRVEARDVAGEVEVLLRPVADEGEVGPEGVGDHVVGVADVEGAIAHPREAGDVLDHLGVVVGCEKGLPLPAVGHGEPADEVRQPDISGPLLFRVLVEVVVELPGFVPDPKVVVLLARDVVEDHEVGEQDLVHPPPGLETVEVVLGGLGLHVTRLVCQLRAQGMDALTLGLEHCGDRVLREPVDLEVRSELAELLGDSHVALRMPQSDGGADEERPSPAAESTRPAARLWGEAGEVLQHDVDLDRIPHLRRMAGALEQDGGCTELVREVEAALRLGEGVGRSMDDEHGAADAGAELHHRLRIELLGVPAAKAGENRLGVRLQAPPDAVLDRLRGMRLREALREEVLEVALPVPEPVMAVLLGPALVGVEDGFEGVFALLRLEGREGRGDEHEPGHPLGMGCREDERLAHVAPADDDCALAADRIEDGQGVKGELPPRVRLVVAGPVQAAVPARVESDDSGVARKSGNLHLPAARVDDLPGGHEQDRSLALPVALPEDADAVALDVALLVGVAGAGVFPRRLGDGAHDALLSSDLTKSRMSRLTFTG